MREGGKKNIEHIFGKVNEGDEIKRNTGQFFRKVNVGDEIKKTFDPFETS